MRFCPLGLVMSLLRTSGLNSLLGSREKVQGHLVSEGRVIPALFFGIIVYMRVHVCTGQKRLVTVCVCRRGKGVRIRCQTSAGALERTPQDVVVGCAEEEIQEDFLFSVLSFDWMMLPGQQL